MIDIDKKISNTPDQMPHPNKNIFNTSKYTHNTTYLYNK